jgi:hypothetical protein
METRYGYAPGAAAPNEKARTAVAQRPGQMEQENGHVDFALSGGAEQAALVIEGESYAENYLERLHTGMAQPDELAAIFAFVSGEMQCGFGRAIAKALEGLRHA